MPLAGTQVTLKNAAKNAALNYLKQAFRSKLPDDAELPTENLEDVANAIAEAVVVTLNHILANAQVAPGIPVTTAGSPSAMSGATVGPGKLL